MFCQGSHIPDAVGSLPIGGLLGAVSAFMISSNSGALVGRSIPDERLKEINRELEGDIMVRQVVNNSQERGETETNLDYPAGLRREGYRHGQRSRQVQGGD